MKRCPFCGGQAKVCGSEDVGGQGPFYYVECLKCWVTTKGATTKEEATEYWERRAYESTEPKAYA